MLLLCCAGVGVGACDAVCDAVLVLVQVIVRVLVLVLSCVVLLCMYWYRRVISSCSASAGACVCAGVGVAWLCCVVLYLFKMRGTILSCWQCVGQPWTHENILSTHVIPRKA